MFAVNLQNKFCLHSLVGDEILINLLITRLQSESTPDSRFASQLITDFNEDGEDVIIIDKLQLSSSFGECYNPFRNHLLLLLVATSVTLADATTVIACSFSSNDSINGRGKADIALSLCTFLLLIFCAHNCAALYPTVDSVVNEPKFVLKCIS